MHPTPRRRLGEWQEITGELNMNSTGKIVQLVNPTANQDAATKFYVDTSIPIGGIIMWSGAGVTLPSNWKLCDGSAYNGITTPDLRGRFVLSSGQRVGSTTNRITGATGGEETVTLSESQMPKHSHGVTASTTGLDGGHTHSISASEGNIAVGSNVLHIGYTFSPGASTFISSSGVLTANNVTSSHHSHTITVSETAKGGNATLDAVAHENMPPFYVLAFIMRVS